MTMELQRIQEEITRGQTCLGIEFGSTRIKAVLVGSDHTPIASGGFTWENQYRNGIWTYAQEDIWTGLQACYRDLADQIQSKYAVTLQTVRSLGFSGMMHGYLAFDQNNQLLVPFRTWRNTITQQAATELTELFGFNVPQRWSISHLYQAILNGETHVKDVAFLTTLSGYVHWMLTGKKVLGVGDASGVFPIDSTKGTYDAAMLQAFNGLVAPRGLGWQVEDLLPQVLCAGQMAGALTAEGAALLDPSGTLQAGIPLCPPEGDAGTGMVATNSVGVRTGNVSAGTSIFAMLVLEKSLSKVYPEIDMVTTPAGDPVAMVHCNNCTSEMNAWAELFQEVIALTGASLSMGDLLTGLNRKSLEGDADCGGVMAYNYLSGEHITHMEQGRPMVVRGPETKFSLANFMRAQLYSTMATMKIGMEILTQEGVSVQRLMGHGGLFKTPGVGQRYMAAAVGAPVSVMETAGEGGAWGMALLAQYLLGKQDGQSLADFLDTEVFSGMESTTLEPLAEDVEGFAAFLTRYRSGLAVERAAVERL